MNNIHDKLTKFNANNIINHTPENKNKTRVPNIGATGNDMQAEVPHFPPTIMGPHIHVLCPNGQTMKSSKPCLLDFTELPHKACEGNIITSITHSSLVSIGKICDTGFTTVFKAKTLQCD